MFWEIVIDARFFSYGYKKSNIPDSLWNKYLRTVNTKTI